MLHAFSFDAMRIWITAETQSALLLYTKLVCVLALFCLNLAISHSRLETSPSPVVSHPVKQSRVVAVSATQVSLHLSCRRVKQESSSCIWLNPSKHVRDGLLQWRCPICGEHFRKFGGGISKQPTTLEKKVAGIFQSIHLSAIAFLSLKHAVRLEL